MYSTIEIYAAGLGSSITVNELAGTLKYPVRRFEWHQPTRGDKLPRLQLGGMHERYTDVDEMPVLMEGDILGTSTSDYWTNRLALMNIIAPARQLQYRYHSQIRITLDGSATVYYAYVTLEDYDAPTEAFFPTRTPFQFQWSNAFGFWRRLSDDVIVDI